MCFVVDLLFKMSFFRGMPFLLRGVVCLC